MKSKRILFISGSIGLGHIVRDLAIVDKLRETTPEIVIDWIAKHPATLLLTEKNEKIIKEST